MPRLSIVLFMCWAFACAGCVPLSKVKIPLRENPGPTIDDSPRVTIEDLRPAKDLKPHRGKDISSCERWFGDNTFEPSKLDFLGDELAQRTPADTNVHLRLRRFDVIEYCEHSIGGGATEAAAAAGRRVPGFTPAPLVGDTVFMRIAGDVNGTSFDVYRQFDYATLYRSPDIPSESPRYRALLRAKLDEMLSEITNIVWRARSAGENSR
jgi:hypothetical protein